MAYDVACTWQQPIFRSINAFTAVLLWVQLLQVRRYARVNLTRGYAHTCLSCALCSSQLLLACMHDGIVYLKCLGAFSYGTCFIRCL